MASSDESDFITESPVFTMARSGISINDAIHKTIHLPPICVAVIDTLEFQRLRALKQCGICHLVYPSATHSRFEHSIGVCHWAQELLDAISRCHRIPKDKQLCVMLAGLCHDLGHGPFSHLWETFLKSSGIEWDHESTSQKIVRNLYKNNKNVQEAFKDEGLDQHHVDLICELINPNHQLKKEEDAFLYEIIANKSTGIDVDKFEYILRDTKQFGMSFSLDVGRILYNVGIVEDVNADGIRQNHIAFRDKVAETLEEMYMCRGYLHKKCCQHKTHKGIELMLIDALMAADGHFKINWEETNTSEDGAVPSKLSECHDNLRAFLKATDSIFYELLHATDPNLRTSRVLIESILKRDLYTLIFRRELAMGEVDQRKELESIVVSNLEKEFHEATEFRSCLVDITYGRKYLHKVKYFTKANPKKAVLNPSGNIKEDYYELLIFCTKGKKSLTAADWQMVEEMKKIAERSYQNALMQLPEIGN